MEQHSQLSNRTDPLFKGTSNTTVVQIGLTTLCTMRCPNCALSMPQLTAAGIAKHADVAQLQKDAVHMQGLHRVHLTGGEPTHHPEFRYIATHIGKWFQCEFLTIETNGTGYVKYRDLFCDSTLFDRVFITHYVKDRIYPNNFDNTHVLEMAVLDLGDRLIWEEPVTHLPYHHLDTPKDSPPCSKWYDPGLPAGWYHGRLYACCVTYGIDQSLGIPVTPDWKEQIQKQSMGCDRCLYAGS